MNNSSSSNYYKIGIFVIIGVILIVFAIILLGSGKLFQKTAYIETYFNESVQGLSVGSPVKYKGMTVGEVSQIALVSAIYPYQGNSEDPARRYIYVEMEITANYLTNKPTAEINAELDKRIKKGLRVKLALQGLTGNTYLELNFENPQINPPLPITWTPAHVYIPSSASTLTRYTDNIGYLLDELKKVDLEKTINDFNVLINNTNNTAIRLNNLVAKTSDNIENISANLRAITEDTKSYPARLFFGNPPQKLDLNTL